MVKAIRETESFFIQMNDLIKSVFITHFLYLYLDNCYKYN